MIDLRRTIKRYNVSQNQLAQEWNVSQPAVSLILSRGKISLAKLEDLARICGCSTWELLREDDCPPLTCPHCGKPIKIKVELA